MKTVAEKRKADTIANIVELLHAHLSSSLAEPAARFARHYYARVAPEDLADSPIEDLYGAVLAHWSLARQRNPGQPLTRIYNPTFEEHGWRSPHTVVEVVCDDMSFLVDSVNILMMRHGISVHLIIHSVMPFKRNRKGQLQDVLEAGVKGGEISNEAVLHYEISQQSTNTLADLETDLQEVLAQVRVVVEDWTPMQTRLREIVSEIEDKKLPVPSEELAEGLDFLHWAQRHNFTFIGFRAFDLLEQDDQDTLRLVPDSGLGIFHASSADHISHIPEHLRGMARSAQLLILTKSTMLSQVHRPAYLDYLGIKRFDDQGQVIGEWRFQGLYSSIAYDTRPCEIPVLRRKVAKALKRAAFLPTGHAGKALQHILDNLPRDELFQADDDELFHTAMGILHLQDHQRLKIFVRRDAYERFMSVLVFSPRERYTTELRLRMQNILVEAFNGRNPEFDVQFSESVLARVNFIIHTTPGTLPDYDVADIEARMIEALLSWEDKLRNELHEQFGEGKGNRLVQHYTKAFPAAYRDDYSARTAAQDVKHLASLSDEKPLSMHLYRPPGAPGELLRFKVFGRHRPVALSDILPMLEKMGLRVLAARPYVIEPHEGISFWIINFEMTAAYDIRGEVLRVKDIFQDAFAKICQGTIENDGFNRLVLAARAPWREVVVLRAICKYLLQTRVPFSQTYMEQTLTENPAIARMLFKLFEARLDPQLKSNRQALTLRLQEKIEQAIDGIDSLDEDRILRLYLATIIAMLRTNYYQPAKDQSSKDYLSFKLDPGQLPELPLPRPRYEIFVYSTRMEGIHLRGGKVARGGLRWSDRREDFRTEILGLMKAQMTKNAVIVPVGAKGGFVTKQLPVSAERDDIQQEVISCYRTFIRGLLDITDNIKDTKILSPRHVVRHDGNDPYLVVAADKGTASFSDIANEIAAEYDFWLGDAFASGGTNGYDHKKMGITARGAWESVKRHFRELGINVQNTPFTTVAIGDMSGDVFGNGMLQSKHIRLIAAFNHQHIFLDPSPDPAGAYRERERLFKLPRSSWSDYNPEKLSKGAGIYSRNIKSVPLSPEARKTLGLKAKRLAPNALIQAILCAPVDLLWNGGIGTYVKASSETHVDAGDRTNDNVRIDARDLRCRVIGEGGNLGLTQRARIEFAGRDGLLFTDAIDNSGGVDCSDHEVNIKILLNRIVANGDMTMKQRNRLLAKMTDEVAELVLRDNYLQTQAISVAASQSGYLLSDHIRLISLLEKEDRLERELEALPLDEELADRENANTGLTRPEIAVLLAYSKIRLYEELLASDIHQDAYLTGEVKRYFPASLQERFATQLVDHSLYREITATHNTNSIVNRMGCTYCARIQEDLGSGAADIARAYTIAREIFKVKSLWDAIEALDNNTATQIQVEMIAETRRRLDRATRWLLRNRPKPLDIAATIEQFDDKVQAISGHLHELLRGETKTKFETRIENLKRVLVPPELAQSIAELDPLLSVLDIGEVARQVNMDIAQVAQNHYEIDLVLDLHWVHDHIEQLPRQNHWHRSMRGLLRDDLSRAHRALTAQILSQKSKTTKAETRIKTWLEENQYKIARYLDVIAELRTATKVDMAMLLVAVRELRNLANNAAAGQG
ncbi:MAG: NAD-glutamate dehydrogenase [Gammaproteobacteria bacterium]|nr:NAD-glutamate dehydrogenase [Gammaproteobacteria bacterium]